MIKALLYDELENQRVNLIAIQTQALFALGKSHNTNDIREAVELRKITLIQQISDPNNPGYGLNAEKIAKEIGGILGVDLRVPVGSPSQIANSFETQIDKLLKAKIEPVIKEVNKIKGRIVTQVDNLQHQIDSAKATIDNIEDDKLAIEHGIKAYNSIGDEVLSFVKDTTVFRFNRQSSRIVEIGKINFSFKAALGANSRTGAFLAAGVSALLGLLVPITIVIVSYHDKLALAHGLMPVKRVMRWLRKTRLFRKTSTAVRSFFVDDYARIEAEPEIKNASTLSHDSLYNHAFLSYVKEDSKIVLTLYQELVKRGHRVWLDRYALQPGVDWRIAIEHAIRNGMYFIACFSSNYWNKSKSYMNEELHIAVEQLRRMPDDQIWFIPIKLSECSLPVLEIRSGKTIDSKQWVELYQDWQNGIERISNALKGKSSIESYRK